jgi:hypothetical protein
LRFFDHQPACRQAGLPIAFCAKTHGFYGFWRRSNITGRRKTAVTTMESKTSFKLSNAGLKFKVRFFQFFVSFFQFSVPFFQVSNSLFLFSRFWMREVSETVSEEADSILIYNI